MTGQRKQGSNALWDSTRAVAVSHLPHGTEPYEVMLPANMRLKLPNAQRLEQEDIEMIARCRASDQLGIRYESRISSTNPPLKRALEPLVRVINNQNGPFTPEPIRVPAGCGVSSTCCVLQVAHTLRPLL